MTLDLFRPSGDRRDDDKSVVARLRRAGCVLGEADWKGLVRVTRNGEELGVLPLDAWEAEADRRGWK